MGFQFTFLCALGFVVAAMGQRFRAQTNCEQGYIYNPFYQRCQLDVPCTDNQWYDQITHTCRDSQCPPGHVHVRGTGQCRWVGTCQQGQHYDHRFSRCVSCNTGSHYDASSQRCEPDVPCRGNTFYDARYQDCRPCEQGQIYDTYGQICVVDSSCPQGQYYDFDNHVCRQITCPPTYHYEAALRRCVEDM